MRARGKAYGSRGACLAGVLLLTACGQVDVIGDVLARDAGPPTGVDDTVAALTCRQAPRVFAQALCTCGPVSTSGKFATETLGGAGSAAHVRIASTLTEMGGSGPIDGDLWLIGDGASLLTDGTTVAGDLHLGTALVLRGTLEVAGNAYVRGELLGEGTLQVRGDLFGETRAPSADAGMAPNVVVDGSSQAGLPVLAAPCGCGAPPRLDIAGFIAAAARDHDARLQPDRLDAGSEQRMDLTLPTGRVYTTGLESGGELRLRVTGKTALFVDGDLRVAGNLRAELDPDADLSIFVAGAVTVDGGLLLGDESDDAAARWGRMYVAGPASIGSAASGRYRDWVGHVYAPMLQANRNGAAQLSGALHVRSLAAVGDTTLRYDPAVTALQELCDD